MIGDQEDFSNRLKALIPRQWFGDITSDSWPIVNALIQAPAYALSFVYALIIYAKQQTRILTATDAWLDLIAQDYLGPTFVRGDSESDSSFRTRILINIFRERATRKAISKVILDITGRQPDIFEPSRPADTGGYGVAMGYGVAGRYGSTLLPYQAFITVYRPATSGIPLVAGYGISTGAYSTSSRASYATLSDVKGQVTDNDIYSAIDSVAPAGVINWVKITT